ncbi:uncharacterized protein TNCT_719351 [Trichonephila clavata]|uniref:Uncharacterized protein n=1 Tax=Trichonephila clavata TaxID=2740835 RepID=A0A8X6G0I6_TRICU|nr:uncharacterized protein TNCT_719351 [Trichonephila clavata]
MSLFNNPNSSHIFNDSEISDDDGDLNILRFSRRTYSKVNYDSGSEESFCKSTTNTKNIASSSLCENDLFFDEKSGEKHENKIINKDRLISLFDYEEDKCSASECDFSDELLPPIFPDKTYQGTGNNMKRKVIEKELNLDEPKSKHPNNNMLLKSVQTFNQQSSASLSMSSKVKSNDTEGNIKKSPLHEANGKCTISKEEIKTNVSSYNEQFTQDSINGMSMLEFVQSFSAEQNQEHINRKKSELKKNPEGSDTSNAKKLTHGPESSIQKIVPKSTGTEKSNNTVIEKSTSTQKLNHGNFEQIKRPDIDKHSVQKPLQIIDDESNSGSSILHSSPLLPFIPQLTDIDDSSECVEVARSNTISTSDSEGSDSGSDSESDYAYDYVAVLNILRHYLTHHTTVDDFCSHPDARNVLSKLSYETDDLSPLHRINHDNDPFQNFLNTSVLSLIREYVRKTILNIFPEVENLDLEWIPTYRIVKYAYEGHNNNEIFYFTKVFHDDEFVDLDTFVFKLCTVALLLIYDNFVKGYRD